MFMNEYSVIPTYFSYYIYYYVFSINISKPLKLKNSGISKAEYTYITIQLPQLSQYSYSVIKNWNIKADDYAHHPLMFDIDERYNEWKKIVALLT